MDHILAAQLRKLEKKEQKWMTKSNGSSFSKMTEKMEEKIPDGLEEKLGQAFYQGFRLVFSKGTAVIEKTYQKERIQIAHRVEEEFYKADKKKRALKGTKKNAEKSARINLGITALEGTLLGILGIGIPDIPIYIGVVLKGIYETALHYGFSYETEAEKYYILILITAALLDVSEKKNMNEEADRVGYCIDHGEYFDYDMETAMKKAADAMAKEMLCVKFIQGLPIIGAVGGITNTAYYHRILGYVKIKYQKRYLFLKS